MQPADYGVIAIGIIITLLSFLGKRFVDQYDQQIKELKDEIKELKSVQSEEKIERTKISGQIDGLKIGANNMAENVRDLKEML